MKLTEIYNQILLENSSGDGKTFYHGTTYKIDLNNLDLSRKSVDMKGKTHTGSSQSGTGLYVTSDLWMNGYDYIKNPIRKEGSVGQESAEKYATNDNEGFIYRITLSNDFRFEDYNYMGFNGFNIRAEDSKKILESGVDGLTDGKHESVILNQNKITSFEGAYYNDGNDIRMDYIANVNVEGSNITSWRQAGDPRKVKMDPKGIIMVAPEDVEGIVSERFNGNYCKVSNKVFANIPQADWKTLELGSNEERAQMREKYPITHPKLQLIVISNGFTTNWKKV